jgi:hypothetical protein
VARLTCIAPIYLSPVVSGLRFIYDLRQQGIILHLIHVARLTYVGLIYLSPILSGFRFIYGCCSLSEKGVVIFIRLQAIISKSDELA